jgi:hypothetical protein
VLRAGCSNFSKHRRSVKCLPAGDQGRRVSADRGQLTAGLWGALSAVAADRDGEHITVDPAQRGPHDQSLRWDGDRAIWAADVGA